MIVVTLTAKNILATATMYVTECAMAKLHNGDQVHCEPDFGNALAKLYPDNFDKSPYFDRPGSLTKGKYEVEFATAPEAVKTAPVAAAVEPPTASTPAVSKRAKTRHGASGKTEAHA